MILYNLVALANDAGCESCDTTRLFVLVWASVLSVECCPEGREFAHFKCTFIKIVSAVERASQSKK
jgi:hypothetical protein